MRTNRRLRVDTFLVSHVPVDLSGNPLAPIELSLTVGRDGRGASVEFVLADAGKTGTGISVLLFDVGVWVSRLAQGRHPMTGEEL